MARPRRTRDEVRDFRDRIREAGRALIRDGGLGALTMRNIAARLGCSAATIYGYFPSRLDVLRSLWFNAGWTVDTEAARVAQSVPDPVERIRAVLLNYAKFAAQAPLEFRTTFLLIPETLGERLDSEQLGVGRLLGYQALEGAVAEAVAAGHIARCDPALTAQALWAAVHGAVALPINLSTYRFADPEQLVVRAVELAVDGLRPNAARGAAPPTLDAA